MYLTKVNKILSENFDTVKGDAVLALLLIKTYSILYKSGKQVRTCENSMRRYYVELQKTGKMKAEMQEQIKNRTCDPSWEGIKEIYFKTGIFQTRAEVLTDENAIIFLKAGKLKEEDFKVLPKGYKKPRKAKATKENKEVKG